MLLSEQELERMQKRFPYPRFSRAEYQRRYGNIRRMMRDLSLDCLLIIGGSAAYGRLWFNFRYVTNMMGKAEMANYCFFPKEGEPAVVTRPGHSLAGGMLARQIARVSRFQVSQSGAARVAAATSWSTKSGIG